MPLALYALTAGAFGIGVTEFVIMGLLLEVSTDLGVSIPAAGLLISGYALGVVVGAPVMTVMTRRWPRKTVLLTLMLIFTLGNAACALAPSYASLMMARVDGLRPRHLLRRGFGGRHRPRRRRPARLGHRRHVHRAYRRQHPGRPFGTWLGQMLGWRATFWAVTLVGVVAMAVIALFVPRGVSAPEEGTGGAICALWRGRRCSSAS